MTTGAAEVEFFYGIAGDVLIAGDWDGDGDQTVGVLRASTESFYLRNSNSQGFADGEIRLRNSAYLPVVADPASPTP